MAVSSVSSARLVWPHWARPIWPVDLPPREDDAFSPLLEDLEATDLSTRVSRKYQCQEVFGIELISRERAQGQRGRPSVVQYELHLLDRESVFGMELGTRVVAGILQQVFCA